MNSIKIQKTASLGSAGVHSFVSHRVGASPIPADYCRTSIQLILFLIIIMLFRQFALAAATLSLAKATNLADYEYVVVGSGAGKLD